ncbi:MAG: hypothetical protein LBE18_02970, partial [Planctomycetaceae bacterium]|nr:hypothetical protein [Planctomycetaceae bacterium]
MKNLIFLLLMFIVVNTSIAQEQTQSNILSDFLQGKIIFDFSVNPNVTDDVISYSTPPKKTFKVEFNNDSGIFNWLQRRLKKFLAENIIPDLQYIKNHTQFYSVRDIRNKSEISTIKSPRVKNYDIAYFDLQIDTFDVLIAFTGDQGEGATYLYVKNSNKKNNITPNQFIKSILQQEAFKLVSFIDESTPFVKREPTQMLPDPNIPVFIGKDCFCIVRPIYFTTEGTPKMGIFFTDWFSTLKKWDKSGKEQEKIREIKIRLFNERENLCKTSITTESGRANLISLIGSDQGKTEFGGDTHRYNNFRELPYTALNEYYNNLNFNKRSKLGFVPIRILEISTPIENDALRKLLQSTDIEVKRYGLILINITNAKSLLPDLLKHATDKDQVIVPSPSRIVLPPTDTNFNQREYHFHFRSYSLLGKFGNQRTIKSLEQLRQSDKISAEAKEDADLAIELI